MDFFETYGLLIILVIAFVLIMVSYYFRNKKYQDAESKLQSGLKPGDSVKTYSGFYGVVEKITETTDGKVVTLKLGAKSSIDIDIRAISGLDSKQEVTELEVEEPQTEAPAPVVDEVKAEEKVDSAEEIKAEPEEKPAVKKNNKKNNTKKSKKE